MRVVICFWRLGAASALGWMTCLPRRTLLFSFFTWKMSLGNLEAVSVSCVAVVRVREMHSEVHLAISNHLHLNQQGMWYAGHFIKHAL